MTSHYSAVFHPTLPLLATASGDRNVCVYNTDHFNATSRDTHHIILDEYHKYQQRLRQTISQLPRGSKEWWSYNRQLLNRKTKTSSIPPLRDTDRTYVHDAQAKADLLAKTFTEKSKLPPKLWGKKS